MEKNQIKKEERIREKELLSSVITNKMIIVFLALVFAIAFLMKVGSPAMLGGFLAALPYVQLGFAVLTAAALVWYIVCKKRGVDEKRRVLSSPLLLGLCASGLFVSLVFYGFGDPFKVILALLALTLLFFVYQVFDVDFYLASVAVVASALAQAIFGAAFGFWQIPVSVLAALVALAAAVLAVTVTLTLARAGKMVLFGKKLRRPMHTVPAAIVAVAAASVVTLAAALFLPLLWCIAALAVVYLIVAIIYTVKLM